MNSYISILRGINVGGRRKILMKDLKDLYLSLGFENVITYIQSGNVYFSSSTDMLEHEIEFAVQKAIYTAFGHDVPVIVRNTDRFIAMINNNPFIISSNYDINSLYLTFLKNRPIKQNIDRLNKVNTSPDCYRLINSDIYIQIKGKSQDSKFTNNFFESKLRVKATNRNWKTIMKLHEIIMINQ